MELIKESYQRLFPNKEFLYQTTLEYNRRLSPFNANITLHKNKIKINMNLEWKSIDEEIKIGLIQHLLLRILKKKANTTNIDIYTNFTKNIHILTPKNKIDPHLEQSFNRVNNQFFQNALEKPNLIWGKNSKRKLACYNFHNDTISVSTIFKENDTTVLDYIMYHEMLHKHLKFKQNNSRHAYHTKEFKEAERLYPHYKEIEKQINTIIRSTKIKEALSLKKQKNNLMPKKTKKPFNLLRFFK
jgi:predicted SprT family Zn-dependent metalloprotease